MPTKKSVKHFFLVFGLFLLLTVVLTFPLVFELNTSVFGYPSDNFSTIWYFDAVKKTGLDFSQNVATFVRYPLGVDIASLPPELAWSLPFLLLTLLTSSVAAFNLITILGFALTAVSMYFLIYYLIGDLKISFLAGFVFAFAPYHFWQGFVHFNLGLLYTLPVYVLALLYFDKKRNFKSSLFLAISFLLTVFTSFYYGLFMVFLTVGFFLGQITINLLKRKNYLTFDLVKSSLIAVSIVLVVISPLLYRVFIQKAGYGTSGSLPTRPLNDLLSLSMRPWDFLLPASNHPFLGEISSNLLEWIRTRSADFKTISAFLPERVVYLGLTTVAVFLTALGVIFRQKKYRHLTIVILISLVLLLLISSPPFIIVKNVTIAFPITWIYPLIPFFRVYARIGIVVLLLVLVVASLGLKLGLKNPTKKKLTLALISILIFFEFLPFGWGQTTNLKIQPVYSFVKSTPKDSVIAEYPIDFDTANSLIHQRYHQKNLYTGFYGDEIIPKKDVADLADPSTWLRLKAAGVDYVIFHTKYLYDSPHPINDFYHKEFSDKIPVGENFIVAKQVASFDNAIVYIPTTREGKVVYLDGKKKDYEWLFEDSWEWSDSANTIYLNNTTNAERVVSYDFKITSGAIREQLFAGQPVKNGEVVTLKPGLNELLLINSQIGQKVTLNSFKLTTL